MQLFCQSQNYVSLDTLEFIVKEHKDLVVKPFVSSKYYRLKLYTKDSVFFLGSTRKLLRIPSKSKYPNLWHYLAYGDNAVWCLLLHIELVYSRRY